MTLSTEPNWIRTPEQGTQINSTTISADGNFCLLGTSSEYDSGDFGVFAYNQNGDLLWNDPWGENLYQGVFWTAVSQDGRFAAAGGRTSTSGNEQGLLCAYEAATGNVMLREILPGRVNEVEMSANGTYLVAVMNNQVRLYANRYPNFELVSTHELANQYCISCGISDDGKRIVVGSYRSYHVQEGALSMVQMFQNDEGHLTPLGQPCTSLGKILRVAIVHDGSWWGASTHSGQCAVFSDQSNATDGLVWTYAPPEKTLSVAYAFAICKTPSGEVFAACGANEKDKQNGCVFAVENMIADTQTGFAPRLLWVNDLQFDPNPGVNMDAQARYVTATDGQPIRKKDAENDTLSISRLAQEAPDNTKQANTQGSVEETPGNFYLYRRDTGEQLLKYETSIMNWPMAISSQGNAIFAASDNGHAYYWRLA